MGLCSVGIKYLNTSYYLWFSNSIIWGLKQWIQKWPKRAALIRIADKGGWFEQFRVLLILRISPIPYPLFNYAIATTNVEYGPYICSSAAILVPEAFITIYRSDPSCLIP